MAMAACTNSSIKTKHIKVKHPKRKLYRASEPLLSVFMWGINHTVRELSHISIPVMLMPDDFRAFTKIKVDNFAFNKENLTILMWGINHTVRELSHISIPVMLMPDDFQGVPWKNDLF